MRLTRHCKYARRRVASPTSPCRVGIALSGHSTAKVLNFYHVHAENFCAAESSDACTATQRQFGTILQNKMLLLHGLLSSPQEFGLIAHSLRSRGVAHEAPSLPGYTHQKGQFAPDWQRWRSAAIAALDARSPGSEPVILGGLCIGGVLAASLALEAPERVAGLVFMSPSFDFDGWGLSPVRHLRHLGYWTGLDRFFSVAEREPFGVKNPRLREWIARELRESAQSAAGPARVPLRALREAERMLKEVRSRLHEINCPILIIHARDDEITRFDSVTRLFATLPQRDKELVVLENSYHMVTIDNDRQLVVSALERFSHRLARTGADQLPSLSKPSLSDAAHKKIQTPRKFI
jgi:carboxylesterase